MDRPAGEGYAEEACFKPDARRYDVSSEAERRTISKAVRYALGRAWENREEERA